jgi:hypothetical protein
VLFGWRDAETTVRFSYQLTLRYFNCYKPNMKWVTRWRIHVNRTATAWLIRRLLDHEAELLFVEPEEMAGMQAREGACGFDAPGALYAHLRRAVAEGRLVRAGWVSSPA